MNRSPSKRVEQFSPKPSVTNRRTSVQNNNFNAFYFEQRDMSSNPSRDFSYRFRFLRLSWYWCTKLFLLSIQWTGVSTWSWSLRSPFTWLIYQLTSISLLYNPERIRSNVIRYIFCVPPNYLCGGGQRWRSRTSARPRKRSSATSRQNPQTTVRAWPKFSSETRNG